MATAGRDLDGWLHSPETHVMRNRQQPGYRYGLMKILIVNITA
jgi:hypothetical protein